MANTVAVGTSRLKQRRKRDSFLILTGPADVLKRTATVKVEKLKANGVVWDGEVIAVAEREGKNVVAVARLTYAAMGEEIPSPKPPDNPMLKVDGDKFKAIAPILCSISVAGGVVNDSTGIVLYGDGD